MKRWHKITLSVAGAGILLGGPIVPVAETLTISQALLTYDSPSGNWDVGQCYTENGHSIVHQANTGNYFQDYILAKDCTGFTAIHATGKRYESVFVKQDGTKDVQPITEQTYTSMTTKSGTANNPTKTEGQPVLGFIFPKAHAAIAQVASTTGASVAHNVASLTYAADATGGSFASVGVGLIRGAGSDTTSTVTYAAASMTKVDETASGVGNFGPTSLWYIDAPASGSNNVVITPSGSTNVIIMSNFNVLSGTKTPSPAGNSGKTAQTASQTAESTSVTTAADNSYIVDIITDDNWGSNGQITSLAATSPAILRSHFGEGTLAGQAIDGMTRTTTTAGAYTIAGTFTPGNAHSSVALEVKVATAAAATFAPWQFDAY